MLTDCYGKILTIGTRVAFNYQGEVRLGTIEEIKSNRGRLGKQYPGVYGNIFIVSRGKVAKSKVTNIRGIVSLEEWP